MIGVDCVEDHEDVFDGEGRVQAGDHVFEALKGEVAFALLVVGLEGLLQRDLLVCEHSVQSFEALLDFFGQLLT